MLAFLDANFVITRFRELPFDRLDYWRQSATSIEDLEKWFAQQGEKITGRTWTTEMEGSVAAFEIIVTLKDGKRQLKRVLVEGVPVEEKLRGMLAKFPPPTPPGGMVA